MLCTFPYMEAYGIEKLWYDLYAGLSLKASNLIIVTIITSNFQKKFSIQTWQSICRMKVSVLPLSVLWKFYYEKMIYAEQGHVTMFVVRAIQKWFHSKIEIFETPSTMSHSVIIRIEPLPFLSHPKKWLNLCWTCTDP